MFQLLFCKISSAKCKCTRRTWLENMFTMSECLEAHLWHLVCDLIVFWGENLLFLIKNLLHACLGCQNSPFPVPIFVCLIGTRCLYKRARDFARRLLATWSITWSTLPPAFPSSPLITSRHHQHRQTASAWTPRRKCWINFFYVFFFFLCICILDTLKLVLFVDLKNSTTVL